MYQKRHNLGISHVLMLVTLLAVGSIGFVGWKILGSSSIASAIIGNNSQISKLPISQQDLSKLKTFDDINKIAQTKDKNIINIKLQDDGDNIIYTVYYNDNTAITYDAYSGAYYDKPSIEPSKGPSLNIPHNLSLDIDLKDAVAVAKNSLPSTQIKDINLGTDNNTLVYSIQFEDDSQISVSTDDGMIVRQRESYNIENQQASNEPSPSSEESKLQLLTPNL